MSNQKISQGNDPDQKSSQIEGVLWFVLVVLILLVGFVLVQRNWDAIQSSFGRNEINDFDQVIVRNYYNQISLESGPTWELSYETGKIRSFAGLVRHTSPINEPAFSILTFDILVTSGD